MTFYNSCLDSVLTIQSHRHAITRSMKTVLDINTVISFWFETGMESLLFLKSTEHFSSESDETLVISNLLVKNPICVGHYSIFYIRKKDRLPFAAK